MFKSNKESKLHKNVANNHKIIFSDKSDCHETITKYKMLVFSPSRGEFLDPQPVNVLPQVHDHQQQAVWKNTKETRSTRKSRRQRGSKREMCSSVNYFSKEYISSSSSKRRRHLPHIGNGAKQSSRSHHAQNLVPRKCTKSHQSPLWSQTSSQSNQRERLEVKQVNFLKYVFSRYQGMADVVQLLPCLAVDVLERGWEVVCHELVPRPVPEFLSVQTWNETGWNIKKLMSDRLIDQKSVKCTHICIESGQDSDPNMGTVRQIVWQVKNLSSYPCIID